MGREHCRHAARDATDRSGIVRDARRPLRDRRERAVGDNALPAEGFAGRRLCRPKRSTTRAHRVPESVYSLDAERIKSSNVEDLLPLRALGASAYECMSCLELQAGRGVAAS